MTTASILDRLDPVKVELLIAHLAEHFRGKVLPKEDSTVMRGVAEAFDVGRLLGIVPGVPGGDVFLRDYATTIGPFVFIPRAWTPRQRLLVVLHELCHVVQFWSAPWGFPVLYLSQPEARAAFEAQAYRAEPEAIYVLEGRTNGYTPENTVAGLTQGYNLSDRDVMLAQDMSDVALTSIANGIIRLPPVLEMESFLKARGGIEWLAAA